MQERNPKNGQFKKKSTYFIIIMGLAFGLLMYHWNTVSPWLEKMNNEPVTVQNVFVPIAEAAETPESHIVANVLQAKEDILDTLAKCESGGKKEEDGITILDTNNKGSYGPFQFQRTTVIHYHQKMTGETISGVDAIILALKDETARPLARYIIFETDAGVKTDWVNCNIKHDLQMQVDLIKRLTK